MYKGITNFAYYERRFGKEYAGSLQILVGELIAFHSQRVYLEAHSSERTDANIRI